ncbi:hypothetical protein LRM36_05335 [Stenotrophomonas maltophilia]|nr:hypothetical protein [Stenotrophomonas maltophilia]
MDKTFEVVRIAGSDILHSTVRVMRLGDEVFLVVSSGLSRATYMFLPSEAVTIGEQLIAAGKAGE